MIIRILFSLCFFSQLAQADELDFALGKALFDRLWVAAPASTQATDGLGPLFNVRSCEGCHPKGGRGILNEGKNGQLGGRGFVVRIGSQTGNGDPVYGRQLQTSSIPGHKAEGQVYLKDGNYIIDKLGYGAFDAETAYGVRLSPALYGLGWLESVRDEDLFASSDPEDRNGDGISGRVNVVNGRVGRFGWKAAAPDLRTQAANAFSSDIGLSTPVHPEHYGDCTDKQDLCREGPHGDSEIFDNLEVDEVMLGLVSTYLRGLKPPSPVVSATNQNFIEVGCADCHKPTLPLPNGETIAAYTDLLLHDMGPDLTDGIREYEAGPNEWRTAPLWGIRSAQKYLHDGRASTIEQAIEAHGGEASAARARFGDLSEEDKTALLNFVKKL